MQGELKRWQDPSTKEVFLIDSRTGHSFPALTRRTGGRTGEDEGVGDGDENEEEFPVGVAKRMSLKRGGRDGENGKEVPRWLESTLKVRLSFCGWPELEPRLESDSSLHLLFSLDNTELHES